MAKNGSRGWDKGYAILILQLDIFKNVFDEYSFFITLNLIDSGKPYALGLGTINQKFANLDTPTNYNFVT